jgi:iron complex outermembrane receptor protein
MSNHATVGRRGSRSVNFAVLAAVQFVLAGHAAFAADDPANGGATTAPTNPAANQGSTTLSGTDQSGLQEVVVTAQFVKQDIQTTPISMSALTGEMLDQRGVTSIIDVANSTPNILMREGSSGEGMSNTAYIRGIGQNDFLFAYSPRVSFYIDDVYFATVYGSVFDLMDISRVEILRGPQGTLFGRNAVGGAIRIFSQEPKGDGSGYVELDYGSYNKLSAKGMIDLPVISDKLMVRFSFLSERQDGYVTLDNFSCSFPGLGGNLPTTGTNTTPNNCKEGTLGATDVNAARVQLRYVINDSSDNNLSFDWTDSRDTASPDTLTAPPQYDTQDRSPGATAANAAPANALIPNGLGVWLKAVGGPLYGLPLGAPLGAGGSLPSPALAAALYTGNPYVSYASFGNPGLSRPGAAMQDPNVDDLKSDGWGDVLTVGLPYDMTVKNVVAYREYNGVFGSSQAALPLPVQEAYQGVAHRQYSEELSLSGTAWDKKIDWTVGGFYLNTWDLNTGRVQFEGFALGGAAFVEDFLIDDPATLKNDSFFVNGAWHITDALTLDAGTRESHETKTYTFYRDYLDYFGITDPAVLAGIGVDINHKGFGNTISRDNPRVALDYQILPNLMAYTSYATGFTAGGINGRPFTAADIIPYQPEDVKAFEVGIKSELFDRTLRLNGALFLTKYDNIQVTLSCFGTNPPTCIDPSSPFYVGNGGNADIKGFELESEWHPGYGLLVTASAGYTDFYYTSLSPDVSGLTLNSPQTNVPKVNVSLGIQDEIHFGKYGSITPRIDGSYRTTTYWNPQNPEDPLSKQDGYSLWNARLTWKSEDPKWQVSLALSNMLDKLYYINKDNSLTSFGYATGTVGAPREFTLSLRRTF